MWDGLIDDAGVMVAGYVYSPFGNLLTKTGSLDQPFRFSTKAFDEQTGLAYYGYRFYSPGVGRWINRDPIGEAGGINLYGFVGNGPVNWVDPFGLASLTDAVRSLARKGVPMPHYSYGRAYTNTQIFNEWMELELSDRDWLEELIPCPSQLSQCNTDDWLEPGTANQYHPNGVAEVRSKTTAGGHSNQCVYRENGQLMTNIPSAGTADFKACPNPPWCFQHFLHDLEPFGLARRLGRISDYYKVRPILY